MDIKIDPVIAAEIKRDLKAIGRQAPFALSLGINTLGLEAQHRVLKRIDSVFHMRGTSRFFERGVVFRKGSKSSPNATLTIGVDGAWPRSATQRASAILARHESGSSRTSDQQFKASGGLVPGGFFIPAKGMRSATSNPARALYPRNIGALTRRDVDGKAMYAKSTKTSGSKRKGTKETRSYFVIPNVGIFERSNNGQQQRHGNSARPVWFFSRRVATPARTRFQETADNTISDEFETFMKAAIARALETAT